MIPIIDLHNDLLSFLSENSGRSPLDPLSLSSYSQLFKGNVKLQTLAIYTATGKDSVLKGKAQIDAYQKLLTNYPTYFTARTEAFDEKRIQVIPAFENASSFADESEPLKTAIERLESYIKAIGRPLYISLTWDEENRFGGGNRTSIGLKDDGKRLLEWMSGKKIAIDMSHTSDKLAYGILDFIEQAGLSIPVIASHSNFRAISNYPRNLPDDLAKEIIRRKGLIGLNFFAPFIHESDPSAIARHVEYALQLGAEDVLSFGADFFSISDFSNILVKYQRTSAFYPELADSSTYPHALELFNQKLKLKEEQLHKIAYKNALQFVTL